MTDIFFSYSSVDRERVRPIRNALAEQGFEVFWDQQVPAGTDWDTWIRQHLAKSKCVMAFWSATSVSSDNVRHEATVAKQQGKLISVLLEPLTAQQFPMGLYAQQAANLSDWNGDYGHDEWKKFRREFETKLTPLWVRRQIDELEVELVGERARREGVERRDRVLQAQIAKEVAAQQDLKEERDKALDEAAGLRATVEELTQARLDAEAREARVQQASKQERDKLLDEAAGLKATIEKLNRARADAEAREARVQQERDKTLEEATVLKATIGELTRAQADAEAREAQAQKDLKRERDKALYEATALRATVRTALFARGPVMQFGSIAAAVATVAFWTYHLVWSASQPLPPTTSEPASAQQSIPANTKEVASVVQQPVPTNVSEPASAQQVAPQAPAQQAAPQDVLAPPVPPEGFTMKNDTEAIFKGPLAGSQGPLGYATYVSAHSTDECLESCRRVPTCKIFTYSKNDGMCYRYPRADFMPNTKFDSGIRIEQSNSSSDIKSAPSGIPNSAALPANQPVPTVPTGLFTLRRNTDATGYQPDQQFRARSIGECEQKCAETDVCKIFSYGKSSGTCYTYSRANLMPDEKFDSGIRIEQSKSGSAIQSAPPPPPATQPSANDKSAALPAQSAPIVTQQGVALAQNYPTKPVTMVVPFAAGGPTDLLGRVLAPRMSEILGQQVVVENVGGAGGTLGSKRVADAAPDGYNFIFGSVITHAQSESMYKNPPYTAADFTPVALIAELPWVLIARKDLLKDLPVNNLQQFIAYAKTNQSKMRYGSAGAGSSTHLGCVLLNSLIGVDITHVPYRGIGPALQDLQAGRIDYLCEYVVTAKPQIDGGTVKPIAIMAKERSSALPNVPTALEQGIPNLEVYTWYAFFLPKGTPTNVVKKLHDAAVQAMGTPAVKERFEALGAVIVPGDRATPEYLGQFVKSEVAKWAAPIKASGVTRD